MSIMSEYAGLYRFHSPGTSGMPVQGTLIGWLRPCFSFRFPSRFQSEKSHGEGITQEGRGSNSKPQQ